MGSGTQSVSWVVLEVVVVVSVAPVARSKRRVRGSMASLRVKRGEEAERSVSGRFVCAHGSQEVVYSMSMPSGIMAEAKRMRGNCERSAEP